MKAVTPTLTILSCTVVASAGGPSSYLRGGSIDNFDVCIQFNTATTTSTPAHHTICCQETGAYCQGGDVCLDHYFNGEHMYCDRVPDDGYVSTNDAFVQQLPCRYRSVPINYEICMNNNVTGCQDESDRASKQCYKVSKDSMVDDWYVCSPASQCNSTARTTPSLPNNAKRQVPGYVCKEHTGAECINRDVCKDHYFNGRHYYYCEEPSEDETTTPPGPTCIHQNQECDPDPNESKQCCGTLNCAKVDENVPESRRKAFGGIKYACLSRRASASDYYLSEE